MAAISGVNSSVSALRAFGIKSQVTANNVANVNTDGFNKSRADLVEGNQGGVDVEISQSESAEKGNLQAEATESASTENSEQKDLSNVDIAEEMANTMTTERFYSANTKMVQADDEMKGTVINMVG